MYSDGSLELPWVTEDWVKARLVEGCQIEVPPDPTFPLINIRDKSGQTLPDSIESLALVINLLAKGLIELKFGGRVFDYGSSIGYKTYVATPKLLRSFR